MNPSRVTTRRQPLRRLLAGGAVGVVLFVLVPIGPAGAARSVCPRVWTHGHWTMLQRPEGLGDLRGAAVDVDRPDTVYVTDGRRIARSTSGGCSWRIVLDIAPTEGLARAEITSVVVPQGRSGRVYATVDNSAPLPGTSSEAVLASFDRGRSWQGARGLPALRPGRLRASPTDPDVMYLSTHTGQPRGTTVTVNSVEVGDIWSFHVSTDAGRSWTQTSAGQHRARFLPDPTDHNVVWAIGSETSAFDGPYRSADRGRTWTPTASQPTNGLDPAEFDVYRPEGRPAQIVVAQGGGPPADPVSVSVSDDGGETFRDLPTRGLGGALSSVAFGRSERDVVVSSNSGVYRFTSGAKPWFDVDSLYLAPLRDATRIRRPQPSWWFWRPELVALYRETRPLKPVLGSGAVPPPPEVCSANREFASVEHSRGPPAILEVLDDPLALQPSVPSRADFRLSLPAVPTALDTYFLLDTSLSMNSAIDGVVCGLEQLVDGLAGAGVDAHFGLGEFQDANGLRYRRVVDIGPAGSELQHALRTRELEGGEEPHRGALYQTATGAGLRSPSGSVLIRPRQEATYRPDALRVALVVTDEPYAATTPYEPATAQVISALRSRGIHHIGIHVRSAAPLVQAMADDAQTRRQLEEFSRGTRTFAPDTGVDCDGDGSVDLAPGAPLVCTVDREGIQTNLAETLTALLLAVRENGIARLRPVHTAGMQVDVTGGRHIDVRDDYTGRDALPFSASITCTEEQAGIEHTLVMAADVSGREVARTPLRVNCGDVARTIDAGRPPAAVADAPTAVAPAPVPATGPSVGSSLSSAVATNPVSAPTAGLVGEMPAAGAAALAPEEREPGIEPSSYSFSDAATAVRVVGAGALFGGVVILERRRRTTRRAVAAVRR